MYMDIKFKLAAACYNHKFSQFQTCDMLDDVLDDEFA